MRNNDPSLTELFRYATNGKAMNAHAGVLVLPEALMRESMTSSMSVFATQLVEAACRARDGDREAAREYIARAVALLYDGCVDDGNELQKKCLRTGAVRGRRMELVGGRAQIFPLLRNLCHAPTNYRSLSRRETVVLQMIARGMSNKCIARSLGIAPETVKTHVKAILSKLKARTRAQAVARAAHANEPAATTHPQNAKVPMTFALARSAMKPPAATPAE